ncbi:MAG: TrmH family RNA methyltransferase [Planctomycetota bacterium]|jgi:TrmH family RNA methyltransferase
MQCYKSSMQSLPEPIRSLSNALLQRVRALAGGSGEGEILLEGRRLIADAISAGVLPTEILVRADRLDEVEAWLSMGDRVRPVAPKVYARLGSVKNPPPVMALAPIPSARGLGDLKAAGAPLVLVVAGVSDPGNLGALARSAEAAGASALIQLQGGVSPWNPRALRGSMGSLLRLPVVLQSNAEQVAQGLSAAGFRHVVAATRGGATPQTTDWSGPIALWVCAETGDAPSVCEGMQGVTIPLAAPVESLNVTVATSLLLFAAGRVGGDGRE